MADQTPPPSAAALTGQSVFVRGLRLDAEIGVNAHERGRRQPLIVDIELTLDPHPIRRLADTLNYERLVEEAQALAARGHVELAESFAERLATACLAYPRAVRARVRVEKPEAIGDAAGAGAEVVLSRL